MRKMLCTCQVQALFKDTTEYLQSLSETAHPSKEDHPAVETAEEHQQSTWQSSVYGADATRSDNRPDARPMAPTCPNGPRPSKAGPGDEHHADVERRLAAFLTNLRISEEALGPGVMPPECVLPFSPKI